MDDRETLNIISRMENSWRFNFRTERVLNTRLFMSPPAVMIFLFLTITNELLNFVSLLNNKGYFP